jgi:Tfp pilus assembly protein PilN
MINLLPDDFKKEVRAARTNVTLLNYIIIVFLGVIFLCGAFIAVYFILSNTKSNAEAITKDNSSRTTSYSTVEQQAGDLTQSLAGAKVILDNEVDYSKILTNIAAAMPDGVVLSGLTLTPSSLGTPTTLQAYAKTTADALQLKTNFQQSALFSSVAFQSLTASTASSASGYPISVSISVTINKVAAQ